MSRRPSEWLRVILVIIFRRYKLIFSFFLIITLLTLFMSYMLPPLYQGNFSVLVKGIEIDPATQAPGVAVNMRPEVVTPDVVANEEQIMGSATLAQRVAEVLRARYGKPGGGLKIPLSWWEEANPVWLQSGIGWVKEKMESNLHRLGVPSRTSQKKPDSEIAALQSLIAVTPVLGTHVISVEINHPDYAVTEDLLKIYLEQYQKLRKEIWQSSAAPDFFKGKADDYWRDWGIAKQNVQDRISKGAVQIPAEQKQNLARQLDQIELESRNVGVEVDDLSRRLKTLEAMETQETASYQADDVVNDPLFKELRTKIGQLQGQRTEALKNYSENSPQLAKLDSQYELICMRYKQMLMRAIKSRHDQAVSRKQVLETNSAQLTKQIIDANKAEAEINVLTERDQLAQNNVRAYEQKFQETRIMRDMREAMVSNISVVSQPHVAGTPVFPRRPQLIVVAMFFGFFVGLLLAIGAETLDDSFKIPEEITLVTGLPVLASFPVMELRR